MNEDECTDAGRKGLYLVGWTTVDSEQAAGELARKLIRHRLAACVQVDGPVRSHFFWEGDCRDEEEYRLWVKTRSDREEGILSLFRAEHPYDTPQWVTVPAHSVAAPFGEWMRSCLANESTDSE